MKYASLLNEFIAQANTTNLKTAKYSVIEQTIRAQASFGKGNQARIPWISFTKEGHTTANGIYPVYLYFKSLHLLILAYGVSETHIPSFNWQLNDLELITDYFKRMGYGKPERYGSSYIFKVYDPNHLPSDDTLDQDLQTIINIYHKTTNSTAMNRSIDKKEPFNADTFRMALHEAKLVFSDQLVTRYIASLLTKPFVILTGLSGSGKTQLAKSFAQWICPSNDQYCVVPVGADWTNRDQLLGYPNGLKSDDYVLPETDVLQLILRATDNPELPHFLILDEMNLSHVERYFADFLSAMESHSPLMLHDRTVADIPKQLLLPKNLFITGTVNIDETTYMFSPKVLDRANVIEFRINRQEMRRFLIQPVRPSSIADSGRTMGSHFVELARQVVTAEAEPAIADVLNDFFEQLQEAGAEFGYRTAAEIHRLMHYLVELGVTDDDEKIDISVMQKLLPKLHGSRRKLCPVLEVMTGFCILPKDAPVKAYLTTGEAKNLELRYPLTLGKLKRMYQAANDNGFASYAEA